MRANYSEDSIRALIESYPETANKRDTTPSGLYALVRIADLDKALQQLPLDYWGVILLHGMLGLPTREVARLLEKSHVWVGKRYHKALEELHYLMNGGE